MADGLTVSFDAGGAMTALDEIQAGLASLVRPAAQAGAEVLYREVKVRVGSIGRVTGNLSESIYQVYSRDNSNETRATYHVSWNARKAPHGHLVEYGHVQTRKVYIGSDGRWYTSPEKLPNPRRVGARPFLRPAWDAKGKMAAEAMRSRYEDGMRRLLAGLA